MKYKLICHFLPWELDYAMLQFIQIKKSKSYLDKDDNVKISTVLNLSDHLIDWSKSVLPKEFFVDKYIQLQNLLIDYEHTWDLHQGSTLYGHLDFQREAKESNIDYYISICPDMYFSETLLKNMIDASKAVQNKYFVIIPEISKLWDNTWDEITNQYCSSNKYEDWNKVDTFQIRHQSKGLETYLEKASLSKWAGWFDLYNKAFFEDLIPVRADFNGYGPYDHYGMIVSEIAKHMGLDFNQYIIRNQVVFEYSVGPLIEGFGFYYKDLLSLKKIPNQRVEFENNMNRYIREWVEQNKSLTN